MALVHEYVNNRKRSRRFIRLIDFFTEYIYDTDELFENTECLNGLVGFAHLLGFNLSIEQKTYVYRNRFGKYSTGYVSHYDKTNHKTNPYATSLLHHVYNHFRARPYQTTDQNIALPEFPGSNILCIDIDTHDTKNHYNVAHDKYKDILSYLYSLYGCHPLFVETSTEMRGMHIYYRTNANNIHKELMAETIGKQIKRRFGRYVTSVDIRSQTRVIRLPFAYDYNPLNQTTFEPIYEDDAVKFCFANIDNPDTLLDYNTFYCDNKEEYDKVLGISEDQGMWTRQRKVTSKASFKFTEGNRVGGEGLFFSFAFYCVGQGIPKEEYYRLAFEFNESSKDLSEWLGVGVFQPTTEGIRRLDSIYDWATRKFNKNKRQSNPNYTSKEKTPLPELNSRQKKILRNYTRKFPYKIRRTYYYMLKEIYLRMNYEDSNPRKVNRQVRLKNKLKKDLTLGHQFPRKFQDFVKDKYSIKGNIYSMFNSLLYDEQLFNQLMTSKRGYLYGDIGSCRQFETNTLGNESILHRFRSSEESPTSDTRYLFKDPGSIKNILLCVQPLEEILTVNNTS